MAKIAHNGRWAAFAGLAVASVTTLVVTMAGPAMADDNGNNSDNSDNGNKEKATSCTEQVRVRSQPSLTAPVIGSCKAGEKVTVDKTENGFAYLVNKSGWASTDYLGLDNKSDNNSDNKSDNKSDNSDDNNDNSDDNNDHHSGGGGGGLL